MKIDKLTAHIDRLLGSDRALEIIQTGCGIMVVRNLDAIYASDLENGIKGRGWYSAKVPATAGGSTWNVFVTDGG